MPLPRHWLDTVDALKESIREKKRRSHEANADRIAGAALLDMAGANLTVELPAELLAQNAEYQMTQLRQRLRKSQMTMELYCKSAGLTPGAGAGGLPQGSRAPAAGNAGSARHRRSRKDHRDPAGGGREIARLSKLHDTPEEEIRKVLSRDAIAARRDQPEGAAFPARPRRPYLCCGKGVRPWAFLPELQWMP